MRKQLNDYLRISSLSATFRIFLCTIQRRLPAVCCFSWCRSVIRWFRTHLTRNFSCVAKRRKTFLNWSIRCRRHTVTRSSTSQIIGSVCARLVLASIFNSSFSRQNSLKQVFHTCSGLSFLALHDQQSAHLTRAKVSTWRSSNHVMHSQRFSHSPTMPSSSWFFR